MGGWGKFRSNPLRALVPIASLAVSASLLAVSAADLAGCGAGAGDFDSEAVISEGCHVASDQRGSFMAKVKGLPLHIQADSGFTSEERAGIARAVATWNAFGQAQVGGDYFTLAFVDLPSSRHSADPKDCSGSDWGTADTFSIVRETSESRWNRELQFGNSIPAATLRCFSHSRVAHQVILTYTRIIDPLQLESIVLHELGHSIGLDHSCTSDDSSPKYRSCDGLDETHPYHLAVMYPTLRARSRPTGEPEIKEALMDNDELRASCLYGAPR
jgi:hypothetical protein